MQESAEPHLLASQVGGHQGVTTSDDDSLIMKPALPTEIAFYQALNSDPLLAPLRPFVPQFIGTLRLEGELIKLDGDLEEKNIRPRLANDKPDKGSLVLNNLTHQFIKPNILDAKLGTVLYDEDALLEKKQRMIEVAQKTTSFETGIRLTGFQVYDNVTNQPILTPKSYGKSIDKSQLPEGIARFLPVGSSKEDSGLPLSLLLPIMEGIKQDIQEIRDVIASLEVRIVGSSLLVIYEADRERAEKGLKWLEEQEDEEDEDEDEDEESDDEDEEKMGPPYTVKLIDFAHTRLTPGKGPDESVLTGIDTMIRLIDGRIKELTP